MKKYIVIFLFFINTFLFAKADLIISQPESVTFGDIGKAMYSMFDGVAPHLEYNVGGTDYNGKEIYVLMLEFDRGSDSPATYSVPNATLLIRTSDETVIKKQSDFNETLDHVATTKSKSVTEVKNGKVITTNTPSENLHHYTAYYQFIFTPQEFEQLSKGIIKIRLQAEPNFEKSFNKDKMGKKIWKQYKDVKAKVQRNIIKKKRGFDDGF